MLISLSKEYKKRQHFLIATYLLAPMAPIFFAVVVAVAVLDDQMSGRPADHQHGVIVRRQRVLTGVHAGLIHRTDYFVPRTGIVHALMAAVGAEAGGDRAVVEEDLRNSNLEVKSLFLVLYLLQVEQPLLSGGNVAGRGEANYLRPIQTPVRVAHVRVELGGGGKRMTKLAMKTFEQKK